MRVGVLLAVTALLVGCGGGATAPAPGAAPAQPAAPAPPSAQQPAQVAPKPAAAQPAAPSKPAAETKPAAAGPMRVTVGSPPSTSGVYPYVVGLAKLLQSKVPGVNVTVSEGAGVPLNARRLREGNFDFAIGTFAVLYAVYSGLDPAFKDQPLTEGRILWVFDPLAQVWFVREDSGITSAEQAQGKDFSPGGQGTGTEFLARVIIFPQLGIQPKWYVGGMADALQALKDRRVAGMGKASALKRPDAVIQDAMTATKIRILGWTPEQVQKVKGKYPFMITADIPAGTYKTDWNAKPLATWIEGSGMWTLAKFSEPLAYAFTKAAVEDNKEGAERVQATAYPPTKEFDLAALTMEYSTVPLHAGSYRYFREIGAKMPDHLKPPEAR